ncbi:MULTISPECIES: dUTP diphosphatase [unclassified Halanaerobium]|uniref:dUTP diphosphatase n=1 Tax=unclassified Halanaerobium TaxID=2641197 RepID=UPI000DF44D23|nr:MULTISPECIES: dUTP diphosphatase [unclassified Halanaerobium]RCW51554.1 dUTP pyrophosphatase [Halanaerobium sp. MA284_MarDTE_T2]RCW89342.1 dUTP pyrophosphatase [Halanaerobium sp. DL-01]
MKIKVQKVNKDVKLPKYQHKGEDCGLDLHSAESTVISPGEYKIVKTGIKIAVPPGYGAFIYPRSGLALKHGITVLNADGVIDPGYRGEIGIILINHGKKDFKINFNDRIAQLIIHHTFDIDWEEVDNLSSTNRGRGGFGHTGHKN